MSKRGTRVGIVGSGYIFPFHLQALERLSEVRIQGIYDQDPTAAARMAERHQVGKIYASYGDLVADVDVIHVLTPPASHAVLCLEALVNGCDVFVEKPLAMTEDECRQIDETAQRLGRIVGVDHSLLMDPFTLRAQQLISAGHIGRPLAVDCLRSQDLPAYRGGGYPDYAQRGGNPFRDLGIHALYQIELFLGPILELQWLSAHQGDEPLIHRDEWRAIMQCERGSAPTTLCR